MSPEESLQTWYVVEGTRGQQLLDRGDVGEAIGVFEAILARLGNAPSYGRAVALGRLGRCCYVSGRHDEAVRRVRSAIEVIGKLAPSDGIKALRGTLRSELGDALRASGQFEEAKKAYEAALKIAEERGDLRGQGIDLSHLGSLALTAGDFEAALTHQQKALRQFQQLHERDLEAAAWHQLGRVHQERREWNEAERHYQEAARITEERGRLAEAAQTWSQLALLAQETGKPETAEERYRKTIEIDRRIGNRTQLTHHLNSFAAFLRRRPDRLGDARQLVEEALVIAQSVDPTAAETWKHYGVLADLIDDEARATADVDQKAALNMRARDYREVQQHAPALCAVLTRIGESQTFGKAVIVGQLGRSFHVGGRTDLAIAYVCEALAITESLAQSEGVKGLRGSLHSTLGDMFRAVGRDADASEAYEASLDIAEELQDLRGQAQLSERLGRTFREPSTRNGAVAFEVTCRDDLTTDYVLEPDLLIDGPREQRIVPAPHAADPLPGDVRPAMLPAARTWTDNERSIHVALFPGEPIIERLPGCTVMKRTRREVVITANSTILWRLVSRMDGASTIDQILSSFPEGERGEASRMLAVLAAVGAIDVSGRTVGRFLHRATKKGVLPAGGLEGDAVLRLATDGNYRAYPEAPRIAVSSSVPDRLRNFHALTRSRRSSRDYGGLALARSDFDALLHTACGTTGSLPWSEREVKLRAYPSSGALYAVEIYPVVFHVEDLEPAVYHYRALENVLEVVRPGIDRAALIDAALPMERVMVAGTAVMVCLTGSFVRHEEKYGEGGYRMLVAEAGHVSQNLILAATALGLKCRPFGGVFDGLLNQELGLASADEQFLLAVIVGR
jgi:SagB-type dehydrogenase family enzyme